MRWNPLILASMVTIGVSAVAAPARGQSADADAPQYKSMPWHLVDVYWELADDSPFQSYSVDVTLSDDVSPERRLYIAPIGLGMLSGTQFYGGLQTQVDGYTKKVQSLRVIGRGLLFSMWGERRLEAIRPADGGYCQSSGHEGDFISVRRPLAWAAGSYTYRLVRMDEQEVDGQPTTWVGAFLHVHETDENIFVGALRFPGRDLVLSKNNLANFVELYGAAIDPVTDMPHVEITFGNVRVNDAPPANPTVTAYYPEGVPDFAAARAVDGAVVVTVGPKVADRTERTVKLMAP